MNQIELTPSQIKDLSHDPLVLVRKHLAGLPELPEFFLYGAGQLGRKLARAMRKKGGVVKGFLDNNPKIADKRIEGLPVLAMDKLQLESNAVCVITIWHYHHDPCSTAQHAEALGFKHVVHFAALAAMWDLVDVLPNFAVDHPRVLFSDESGKRLQAAAQLLTDESSRIVFWEVATFHALPDPFKVPKINQRPLPFRPDIVSSYVDGGAFIGDDFASHLSEFKALSQALLVEPDPQSFKTLANRTFDTGAELSQVNSALSFCNGSISFLANGDWGSKIVEDGQAESVQFVACVTLDTLAVNLPGPIYIKMDLEGHEMGALRGSRELLMRDDVIFSITLEHRALDLIEIPEYLSQFASRSLYLFPQDTEFSMDLVLYSVPNGLVSPSLKQAR